ncbi:MAG: hypothetical protein A2Y38_07535 [Spirochaetes bacterium GWB1_59_5]|nr:MAG: hypothetical protein A2Y38_07535 [Spirochaetes bacterium GWB1_59_5]
MRALTAHPLVIPARPTPIGAELAADWPSWTELFHKLDSLGRRYYTALARPIEDYAEQLRLWKGMSAPFAGEAIIRDIVDGYSEITSFPALLFKQLYRIETDNENVINVWVTENGLRKKALFFPRLSFLVDYLQCLQYTVKKSWCCLHIVEFKDKRTLHLIFEKQYEKVEIEFCPDQNHSANYTLTFDSSKILLDHLWNVLDEWGLKFGLERLPGEHDMFYARRLNDIFIHIGNASPYGITNAVAREFGLLTNLGHFRIPLTLVGESEDVFGDPTRLNLPEEDFPRIFRVTKWKSLSQASYSDTTRRDLSVWYAVLKVKGPGYVVVTPTPDHIYGFVSEGNTRDAASQASYMALRASGKNNGLYVWDANAATLEVAHGSNVVDDETFFILEYRDRVSRVMPEHKPVEQIYIRETTFDSLSTPWAQEYLVMTLMSRIFAVNDDVYKQVHFEHFHGAADFTEEQKQHYLGMTQKAQGRTMKFQNRHEAFTDVTQQGVNKISHQRVAEIINDKTKVMNDKWRWGQSWWWNESAISDPTGQNPTSPRLEACLEYVPNIWDSDFRRPR